MNWPADDIGRSAMRAPHHPNVVAWPGSPRRTHDVVEALPRDLHCLGSRRCTVASDCTSPATCHLLAHVEQPGAVDPVPTQLRKPGVWQRLDEWLTPGRTAWLCAAFVFVFWACLGVWRLAFASAGPL
jgi:hypothetical protein